ncbi:hypothetical protein HGRIS_010662 [Hohenbuehelia grisea]
MNLRHSTILLTAIGALCGSNAKIYENADELPSTTFDFVIIGSGAGGNTIANRLTEDPSISVLVLEAGGSNENVLDSEVPFFCPSLAPNTPFDWNFTTSPQTGLNGRPVAFPRGFMFGGSTSINFMAYTRGSMDDFNRFAKISGDSGWSWNSLQPYIRKNERFGPPADNHLTKGQFNPSVHSFTGINSVSLPGFSRPIDEMVLQVTRELPHEFPFNLDMNSGRHIGISWTQGTIKGGTRSSSATSYLGPNFINRRNIHVLLHAHVTRVLQTGTSKSKKSFRRVEFAQRVAGKTGPKRTLTAKKEIILSAGAVGSPTILLHSGIGDSKALSKLGIKTLHNLPTVGQNLIDHPLTPNSWLVNSNDTFETHARDLAIAAADLAQWKMNQTGYLTTPRFSFLGWLRLPKTATIFKRFADPSAGPNTAHIELLISNGLTRAPTSGGNFLGLATGVVSPASRGTLTINSTDPFAPPIIDPGLMSHEFDLFTMREAVRSASRFANSTAFAGYVIGPSGALANVDMSDDESLNQYIRNTTGSLFHPVGTLSMSRRNAKDGAVDPDLLLKGVDGIRVVDASVMPRVPAAHTQAPTYIIAERAADLIKRRWNLRL